MPQSAQSRPYSIPSRHVTSKWIRYNLAVLNNPIENGERIMTENDTSHLEYNFPGLKLPEHLHSVGRLNALAGETKKRHSAQVRHVLCVFSSETALIPIPL